MRPFAIAVMATALSASSAPAFSIPPPKSPQVRGEGCVEPGAEARCFTVKDMKSARLYTLLIKGMQPEIGSGIEFSGIPHNGVTTCMQGTAIDVQTWTRKDSLKCSQAPPPRKWR
jgi:hypothetical protein